MSDLSAFPLTAAAALPAAALPALPDPAEPHGWTPDRKVLFLDALSRRGNVRLACRLAGVSAEAAYRLRRRDALFAAGWQAALVLARDHVEQVLADRAIDGVEEEVFYHGEVVATRRRFDSRLLLAHLARLDRAADDARVADHAGRFDLLLGCLAGVAVPDELAALAGHDDDPVPPGRARCCAAAAEAAARALTGDDEEGESADALAAEDDDDWYADDDDGCDYADFPLCEEEDYADLADHDPPELLGAALDAARRAAAAGAGACWDQWQAQVTARLDRLLGPAGHAGAGLEVKSRAAATGEPGAAPAFRVRTLSTCQPGPRGGGPSHPAARV